MNTTTHNTTNPNDKPETTISVDDIKLDIDWTRAGKGRIDGRPLTGHERRSQIWC